MGLSSFAAAGGLPLFLRFDASTVDLAAAAVPEPATFSLLALAALGAARARSRR